MVAKRWLVVYEVRVEVEGPEDEVGALKLARGKVALADDQITTTRISEIRRVMRRDDPALGYR